MIIEIESVYGDAVIYGKHFNGNELRAIVKELLISVAETEFVSTFCTRYDFELLPDSENLKVDYIIDLDVHTVTKPKY